MSVLRLPLDWVFRVPWLRSEFKIGKDKAYRLVAEAVEHEYCRSVPVRRADGTVERWRIPLCRRP